MKKIVFALGYILVSPFSVFSFSGEITTDVSQVSQDTGFELKIEVASNNTETVEIQDIQGIENFDIVRQGYSQSSSQRSIVVNGKVEREVQTKTAVSLYLFPKTSGEFTIGPATLQSEDEEQTTNSINVSVGNATVIVDSSTSDEEQNVQKGQKTTVTAYPESNYIPKKRDNFYLYVIVTLGIFFILGFLFLFQKKIGQTGKEGDEGDNREKNNGSIYNTNEKTESRLPKIDDEHFFEKLESYIKNKPKTEKTLSIINEIQKAKYSDQLISKGELLEKINDL